MNISDSYKALKNWSNEHYGLIALAFGVVSLGLAFVQTNRLQNQAVILDYKMNVINEQLTRNEILERERIAYDATLQNDLREVKGYIRGISDENLKRMLEKIGN